MRAKVRFLIWIVILILHLHACYESVYNEIAVEEEENEEIEEEASKDEAEI